MPRTKKKTEEIAEVKKTTAVKPKTTAKKKVSTKRVVKPKAPQVALHASLDDVTVEELLKLTSNELEAVKLVQLIKDYSFEKDTAERIRCVSIAFGNWRYGHEFDENIGTKQNFEEHNFAKANKILTQLVIVK